MISSYPMFAQRPLNSRLSRACQVRNLLDGQALYDIFLSQIDRFVDVGKALHANNVVQKEFVRLSAIPVDALKCHSREGGDLERPRGEISINIPCSKYSHGITEKG
jgi:hypothetical protein